MSLLGKLLREGSKQMFLDRLRGHFRSRWKKARVVGSREGQRAKIKKAVTNVTAQTNIRRLQGLRLAYIILCSFQNVCMRQIDEPIRTFLKGLAFFCVQIVNNRKDT
ncbi:hypothetical protein WQ54_05970 [Bacillus sp. SA1-12]|nr:hypothetical protein WQ54_05970 [Bacillus sp. SA1-12]